MHRWAYFHSLYFTRVILPATLTVLAIYLAISDADGTPSSLQYPPTMSIHYVLRGNESTPLATVSAQHTTEEQRQSVIKLSAVTRTAAI